MTNYDNESKIKKLNKHKNTDLKAQKYIAVEMFRIEAAI